MTHLEFDCSDEKAAMLLQAARLFDEGVKPAEWISVKDRLPEEEQKVLAYTSESQGTFEEYRLCFGWAIKGRVTHWMPLPEPPKEKRR